MAYKNPLEREITVTACDEQVSIKTTIEDVFASILQNDITPEESREMISDILQHYVNTDEKQYRFLMGYVEEVVV